MPGLLLTRKEGDAVQIGEHIIVTVHRIEGRQVVLNFDAPRDVNIRRTELPPREPEAE